MIELSLSEHEAILMWCRLIRARKIAKHGIKEGNIAALAEGFAWFDQAFDDIAKSVASGITLGPNGLPIIPGSNPPREIDGNETSKP